MSKKVFEQYTYSNEGNTHMSVWRSGYHNWNDGKWLTNLCSFFRLNNPRMIVPHHGCITGDFDFNKCIPNDLDTDDIDESLYIEYNDSFCIIKPVGLKPEFEIDNELLFYAAKITNLAKFYYLIRDYAVYLYSKDMQDNYIFQGMILAKRA